MEMGVSNTIYQSVLGAFPELEVTQRALYESKRAIRPIVRLKPPTLSIKRPGKVMNGLYYSMDEGNYLVLHNRTMPVPILEDSDIESNISSEDAGNFSEFSNPQTPPLSRGATDDVKLELQKAIRCRRVAQGLDEMPNLDSRRPRSNQLSSSEVEKRRLRRERNKFAAFKCRQRRKEHMQSLEEETDGLNSANHTLETEIAALKEQQRELEEMLRTHECLLVVNSSDDEDKKPSN